MAKKAKAKHKLKKIAGWLADTPLPAIALISTFILSRWWNNSDFAYPAEVVVPIALFFGLVSLIFYAYRWWLGRGVGVHLATIILSWSLYSYGHLISVTPIKQWSQILPNAWQTEVATSIWVAAGAVAVAGGVGWATNWLVKRFKVAEVLQPYKVLLFALLFIFLVQLARSGWRLSEIYSQLVYDYPALSLPQPASSPNQKPDIYYLVFDRYGNKQALADNYGFDNSDLYSFLASQGFSSREDGYANYPFTMSSISSTLAMEYFPKFEEKFAASGDWQGAFAYRDILNNPPVAQILEQNGYQYTNVGSWWDFTRIGNAADNQPTLSFRLGALGSSYYLSDLERDILNKSALGIWLKKGLSIGGWPILKYDLNRNPQQNFEAQITALKGVAERTDKSTPQFSFAHVLVPHDPYIFTADGSTPTYDSNRTDNGVDETVKYTNQVTYLNTRIKDLIGHIRSKSPNAVIIIQADEGPYPKDFRFKLEPGHYYDPVDLTDAKMRQKFSILASYYLPGDPSGQQIDSSVNAFRVVLNRYLGYSLPILPDCHLSTGDKFTIYGYQEVSDRLTGSQDPNCRQYDPL
ncbi:hypothetical protein A3B63_00530 [Candidatus Saccharibacteria bacterium RIFCSPLOWO2_01_FULL_49_22]|nr:MAG: hypothetical protein A3B63_00530 [Candidatus Saccharibacteria bacterium RIFCSPLOWO2_01_FULL_49_22]